MSAAAPLTSELVASGLDQPLFATFAPGDAERLFIVEQPGVIRILDLANDPPVLLGAAFLDIQARVDEIRAARETTQPIRTRTGGSTFGMSPFWLSGSTPAALPRRFALARRKASAISPI